MAISISAGYLNKLISKGIQNFDEGFELNHVQCIHKCWRKIAVTVIKSMYLIYQFSSRNQIGRLIGTKNFIHNRHHDLWKPDRYGDYVSDFSWSIISEMRRQGLHVSAALCTWSEFAAVEKAGVYWPSHDTVYRRTHCTYDSALNDDVVNSLKAEIYTLYLAKCKPAWH